MAPITAAPPSKAVRYEPWLVTSERTSTGANKQTLGNHLSWQELSSSDLAFKTETPNVILVIEKGGGWKENWRLGSGRIPSVRAADLSEMYLLPSCPESLPGAPLSSPSPSSGVCTSKSFVVCLSWGFGAKSWKLTQLLGEREKKTRLMSVCGVYLFPCTCMDYCFEFQLSLIFSPPPLRIACYFLTVFGSQRYESGGLGLPKQLIIGPASPCTLQKPPSNTFNSASVGASFQQCPPSCVPLRTCLKSGYLGDELRANQPTHTLCVFTEYSHSAAPLWLWKYHCCKSWLESPSLTAVTRLSWKFFWLLRKWGNTHLFLWLPAVSGKFYLDAWTSFANTCDPQRINPCICTVKKKKSADKSPVVMDTEWLFCSKCDGATACKILF